MYEYDGLNRLRRKYDRDDALTTFDYDAAGHETNRVLPGGLGRIDRLALQVGQLAFGEARADRPGECAWHVPISSRDRA